MAGCRSDDKEAKLIVPKLVVVSSKGRLASTSVDALAAALTAAVLCSIGLAAVEGSRRND